MRLFAHVRDTEAVSERSSRRRAAVALGALAALAVGVVSYFRLPASDQAWGRVESPWRDRLASTRHILRAVDARPGMRVLDIGAGVGYYTFKLSRAVGPTGVVYATDLDPEIHRRLRFERLLRRAWNVRPILIDWDDSRLGVTPSSVDVALMVNVYALSTCDGRRNERFLRQVAGALRPGGRFVLAVDFIHSPGWVDPQGHPARCGNLSLDAVVAASAGALVVVERHTVRVQNYVQRPHEDPGYVGVLRLASEVRAGASPENSPAP